MVLHLKTCCCGCKLQTGSTIIGFVSVIVALLGLLAAILGAKGIHGYADRKDVDALLKELEKDPDAQPKSTIEEVEADKNRMLPVHILLAIVNVIHVIVAILLVIGATGGRPHLVKPWIIYSVLALVAQTLLGLVLIVNGLIVGTITVSVVDLVVMMVCVAIGVYFILVVNSYHTELIANNFQSRI